MRACIVAPLALCSWLAACEVTNTGNPNSQNGQPDGLALMRSELQRDTNPMLTAQERAQFGGDSREFAFALYAQVKDEGPNLFFSPYSIATALAMTYAGAQGETEREMASALRYRLPEPTLHVAFNATDLALTDRSRVLVNPESSGDGFQLRVTNASFGQKGASFVPAYLDLLALNYGAGMFQADFAGDPERERKAINDWVLEQTERRVEELLPRGSIGPDVLLVLVNAIYFKASWLEKFDPSETKPAIFHAPNGDVTVQMMHSSAHRYARLSDYQALDLFYISPEVRVLFILPDPGQMAAVEARLDGALFDEARTALSPHSVDLRVPRFRFDSAIKLKPALEALGMRRAFQARVADLSGIGRAPGELYIDDVYHKAFIAMDEQGTEAAAATAVVGRAVSAPPPAEFVLDRPFIFLIYDEPTGQILFAGRLNEPG